MPNYKVGFFLYQHLGHVTHTKYLRAAVEEQCEVIPSWFPIFQKQKDVWQHIPLINKSQTLLVGLRARDQLRCSIEKFDAIFCHTHEAGFLLGGHAKSTPIILSLDATPNNLRSLKEAYHKNYKGNVYHPIKHNLVKRSFERATRLITFSHWAAKSLMEDYAVSAQKIAVIPPGLDLAFWKRDRDFVKCSEGARPQRILFVGGDFRRKGGETLLRAAAMLAHEIELDIVTNDLSVEICNLPNVFVHRGVRPGTPELRALYLQADAFVLPTIGDCSGWAVLEAMAVELPVITTDVGGLSEIVVQGETGLVVEANAPKDLVGAIQRLNKSPGMRRQMGLAARQRVEKRFDAAQNYSKLIELIKSSADRSS